MAYTYNLWRNDSYDAPVEQINAPFSEAELIAWLWAKKDIATTGNVLFNRFPVERSEHGEFVCAHGLTIYRYPIAG